MNKIFDIKGQLAEEIFEKFRNHTKETIPIIINRFKKRIEEVNNTKIDAEKTIKPQYEKFYLKSLDYRSLRFKNSEKRNWRKRTQKMRVSSKISLIRIFFLFLFFFKFLLQKSRLSFYLEKNEDFDVSSVYFNLF